MNTTQVDMSDTDQRIVPTAGHGEMIYLTCKNHRHLRWMTKNIGYIGARSIFFPRRDQPNFESECSCPLSDLVPVDKEPG